MIRRPPKVTQSRSSAAADGYKRQGEIITPGGVLVVTTPNRKVCDPGHLRLYTRPMLEGLFADFPGTVEIKSEGRFWYVIARREA